MHAPISWRWLGLCAYESALATQEATWRARRAGGTDVCLALEHPPTITFGRRAEARDLRVTADDLARRGFTCHQTERGGGTTYHGPGQLVLYPIVDVGARRLGIRQFVWLLEAIMIDVAAAVGVNAQRDARGRGVWTSRGKLGALGIRVREGVSTHGLALNVDVDLSGYELITPCSDPNLPVTSFRREGVRTTVADVQATARHAWQRYFGTPASTEPREARV